MFALSKKFLKDEAGASLVEYALLIAIIGIAAIAFLGVFTGQLAAVFTAVGTAL
jgi:pilus assembly protein Flp/PilA